MLTVAILINGNQIMARSAVRGERLADGRYCYRVTDGGFVDHDPDDGAVGLACKLLDRPRRARRAGPPATTAERLARGVTAPNSPGTQARNTSLALFGPFPPRS